MRYIGVEYDRHDVCLPDSLMDEIYVVAEAVKNQMIADLKKTCLDLPVVTRRNAHIILDRSSEDGLKVYVSVPETS